MSTIFAVTQVCTLTTTSALSFYISTRYDRELVKWNIREVKKASKSTTGTLQKSLEITRWSANTYFQEKHDFKTVISMLEISTLLDCYRAPSYS